MKHLTDGGFCSDCDEIMLVVEDWEPVKFSRITGEATDFQRELKCQNYPTFWQRLWGTEHSHIIQTRRFDGTISEIDLSCLMGY